MYARAALSPQMAITFYRTEIEHEGNLIALLHDLDFDGKDIVMGVGRPVGSAELKALMLEMVDEQLDEGGFIPERMFYRKGNVVGWTRPAGKAYISLKNGVMHAPLPTLAFLCNGEKLKVCALDSDEKPQAHMPVYHAPILNVYAHGGICWGTVKKPKMTANQVMDYAQEWEKALIESVGTHVNHKNTIRLPDKESVETIDYLRFMGEIKEKDRFPTENLAPMNMTLGEFIAEF